MSAPASKYGYDRIKTMSILRNFAMSRVHGVTVNEIRNVVSFNAASKHRSYVSGVLDKLLAQAMEGSTNPMIQIKQDSKEHLEALQAAGVLVAFASGGDHVCKDWIITIPK